VQVGIDEDFVETRQRDQRYAGLPPGSYTFEVAASNGPGPWSSARPRAFPSKFKRRGR